jgi:hypothetical protein
MKQYEGRHANLKNRVNKHLTKLTGQEIDFFSKLKQSDFIELKTALADINNVLTFNMTIAAANWICEYFKIDIISKEQIIQIADDTKPNTKGFDIHIDEPKIIAEVKCISPVNSGDKFGAAQHDSIMNDVHKLIYGKGKLTDTTMYYKFLFLVDLGDRTDKAISQLLNVTKGTSDIANKFNPLKRDDLVLLKEDIINKLDLGKVYIKKLKMD